MDGELRASICGESEINREGLRRILTSQNFIVDIAGPFSGSADSIQSHLIIVDAREMRDGVETCWRIRETATLARIVLITDKYRIEDVAHAFASGAIDGCLAKAICCESLAASLRLIAMGERVLSSEIVDSLMLSVPLLAKSEPNANTLRTPLSSREIEILQCLMDGHPNKVISRRLGIADATVKVHVKAILRKLQVQNRTQAAIWAARRGTEPISVAASGLSLISSG